MKKFLQFVFLSSMVIAVSCNMAAAQEISDNKVAVQIIKDGKVLTDTVFPMKDEQDPEAVKKIIARVLEGDIQVISGKEGHQKMVWITSEELRDKECESHPKYIKVYVEGDDDIEILKDEDLEWVEVDADNVDVYVIKKDDGTKVVKKVRVEVIEDEEIEKGNENEAEPPQKEPLKPEKKKK